MRQVLESGEEYPYMTARCRERLAEARKRAACALRGWQAGQGTVDLFPWMGSGHLLALSLILPQYGFSAEILPSRLTPVYLQVGCDSPARLRRALEDIALGGGEPQYSEGFDFPGKYAAYIPRELNEKAFTLDQLDLEGMRYTLQMYLDSLDRQSSQGGMGL